jgi:hypothetical protein
MRVIFDMWHFLQAILSAIIIVSLFGILMQFRSDAGLLKK